MTDDLVARLRRTLAGIARDECGGDNLSILLASYFEPAIEDDELDDSGTWKQGAIDACNKVLDAIHQHYATAIEAAEARVRELEAMVTRLHDELDIANANHRQMAKQLADAYERCAKVADDEVALCDARAGSSAPGSIDMFRHNTAFHSAANIAAAIRQLTKEGE